MGQSLQLFLNDCNLFLYKTEPDRNTIDNYLEDFGVTTNALGTPESGAAAARQALSFMSFYPRADFEPGLTDLAKFLWPDNWIINKHRLLLGTQWVARRFARRHASSYAARCTCTPQHNPRSRAKLYPPSIKLQECPMVTHFVLQGV